jgi:hypothetical protein
MVNRLPQSGKYTAAPLLREFLSPAVTMIRVSLTLLYSGCRSRSWSPCRRERLLLGARRDPSSVVAIDRAHRRRASTSGVQVSSRAGFGRRPTRVFPQHWHDSPIRHVKPAAACIADSVEAYVRAGLEGTAVGARPPAQDIDAIDGAHRNRFGRAWGRYRCASERLSDSEETVEAV